MYCEKEPYYSNRWNCLVLSWLLDVNDLMLPFVIMHVLIWFEYLHNRPTLYLRFSALLFFDLNSSSGQILITNGDLEMVLFSYKSEIPEPHLASVHKPHHTVN